MTRPSARPKKPRNPAIDLGLHLLRNPNTARIIATKEGLDERLNDLARLTLTVPDVVRTEGLPAAAWMMKCAPATFELAASLDMHNRYSRYELPDIEDCIEALLAVRQEP
jgi:hypothetical protein